MKYEYAYDVNNYKILHAVYDWSLEQNEWFGDFKSEYTYDINGNMTEQIFYYWDFVLNDWYIDSKSEFSYDVNGNVTEEISYLYSEPDVWVGELKYVYAYDEYGYIAEEIYYIWDSELNDWDISLKWKYLRSYDENEHVMEYISYSWDFELNDWIETSKSINYWSLLNTNTFEISEAESFKVFPNPASEIINISHENTKAAIAFEIINMNGQVIFTRQLMSATKDYSVELPKFSKGLYILKIRSEDFTKSKKLIIK